MFKKNPQDAREKKAAKLEKERKRKEKKLNFWRKWATTARVRRITPSMEMRTIWREFVLYLLFLLFVAFSSFGMMGAERYRLTHIIEEIFTKTPGINDKTFADMRTQDDWWNYAQSTLADNFLWDIWFQNSDNEKAMGGGGEQDRNVLLENKIMGSPRLRQVRVKSDSCTVYQKFRKKFSSCYAPYSANAEDKDSFGLGVGTAWNYYSQSTLKGQPYQGKLATYPGGGFYQDVSTADRDSFIGTIELLKTNEWVDRATRALFVDFALYNANANIFCVGTLVMEFPSSGGVLPSWDIKTLNLIHYVNPLDYFVMGCQIMFIAFTIYHIIEEVREITIFKYHYFLHFWNFYDLFLVLICISCVLINVLRTFVVVGRISELTKGGDEYGNFHEVTDWEVQTSNINAITVFFVWVKILKFFKFNKTMCQLTLTLARCSKDVAAFLVIFLIFFLAYAQCGYLMFGTEVDGYGTVSDSCYTLFLTLLGNFDFKSLEKADSICGPIFFISFIFLVVIILLNVFLAIIADSYAEVKADTEEIQFYDMGVFFSQGFRKMLIAMKCVKKETEEEDDDKLCWRMIREMLNKHHFTDDEVDTFQRRYGIEDEDEVLREADAARMLEDMRGGVVAAPEPEETITATELGPAYKKIQANLNDLTNRVDYIEESLIDLLPRVEELIRAIDRIAPKE